MRRILISSLVTLLLVSPLLAHPVPKTNRDRTLVVHVTATALVIDYRLELDEGSIPNELTGAESARVSTRADLLRIFTQTFADATCRTLDASLDGQELRFKCVQQKYTAADHVRCEYRFESPWSPAADAEHTVKVHECNYVTDDFSRIHLYLAADESVRLTWAKAPSAELMSRSSDDRKPGDDNRLRRASAGFRLAKNEAVAVSKPSFPPDNLTYKSEPESVISTGKGSTIRVESLKKAAPYETVASAKPGPGVVVETPSLPDLPAPPETPDARGESSVAEPPESLWARLVHPNVLMKLLLNSREGFALLMLFAGLAGAAHALTPGHGKTLVAAYLVGQRGTYWHAILLGLVTTLTHTGAVMVLAVVMLPFDQKHVLALQELIGGFLIAAFGLWLLIRRLSGQADHFHIGGGHHHHHHEHQHEHQHTSLTVSDSDTGIQSANQTQADRHSHAHGILEHTHDAHGAMVLTKPQKSRTWEVIALGMFGGMVPCGDAVILLSFAISSGHVKLGLPLLLAFSAGLASVLVVLGLMVVGAARVAQLAAPSSDRLSALVRPLPILSAVFVTVMGLWLCYGALNP